MNLETVPDLVAKGAESAKKNYEEFEKGDFTTAQESRTTARAWTGGVWKARGS